MYNSELYHYGRKGMKWYQHIYGEEDSRAKYNNGKDKKKQSSSYKVYKRGLEILKKYNLTLFPSRKAVIRSMIVNEQMGLIWRLNAANYNNFIQQTNFNAIRMTMPM